MGMQNAQGGIPVVILKDGAQQTKGRDAQKNNITAAKLIAEIVHTSLGPRGMDKMLVEISKTTDNELGDGTTSAVILAGALLENAESLINQEVHPTIIVDGYRKAAQKAIQLLEKLADKVDPTDKEILGKIARTSMQTKLVRKDSSGLSDMIVKAVLAVAEKSEDGYKVDIDDIKVEKKAGGSIKDTRLTKGIILDKEVVHSGMPKKISNAKIALINTA